MILIRLRLAKTSRRVAEVSGDTIDFLRKAIRAGGSSSSDFDLNPDVVLPKNRKLRNAAVLVPITTYTGRPEVILTKRASSLKPHPGQIAFPGGKQDEPDTNLAQTALREAWEEIALPPEITSILGELAKHETVTGFSVTPILAHVERPFDVVPEMGEVDEVFSVPLDHFLNADRFFVQYRYWQGVKRKYYAVPYGPYYIWGATARMLRALADRVA